MEYKITKVGVNQHDGKSRKSKARMYFWPVGETVVEQLFNRRNRPNSEYRKLVTLALVEAGIELSQATRVKAQWSQYAGCSCPCSPGFILSELYGKDFHITYEVK